MTAMVARKPANQPVFDHPTCAIGTLKAVATCSAQGKRRKAAAVEEQQALLAAFHALFQRLEQCGRNPMLTLGRVQGEIDGLDFRHFGRAEPRRDFQPLIAANCDHMARFQRGRGRRQHDGKAFKAATHHGNIAGMVPHAIFLLETALMRFVDDDEPQIGKGQEQSRPCTDKHLCTAVRNRAPHTAALR